MAFPRKARLFHTTNQKANSKPSETGLNWGGETAKRYGVFGWRMTQGRNGIKGMLLSTIWGFSSAGRAPALQAGGQRFDPANLHHKKDKRLKEAATKVEVSLNLLEIQLCTLKTEHCEIMM